MEIGLIRESLIKRDFEVLDETGAVVDILKVTWDRNLFTGDYDRRQARMYESRVRDIDSLIRKRYPLLAAATPGQTGHGGRRKRKPRATKAKKGARPPAVTPGEEDALETAAQIDELTAAEDKAGGSADLLGKAVEQFVSQKEIDAVLNDLSREIIADSLGVDRYGVLKRWSMTRQTVLVEPTFEELVPLPLPFLSELEQFMRSESLPKGARMLRVRTTSDSTDVSSPSDEPIQTPESQTM